MAYAKPFMLVFLGLGWLGAPAQTPSTLATRMSPAQIHDGTTVTVTLTESPNWPVTAILEVGNTTVGTTVFANAAAAVTFLVPPGSTGESCVATFLYSSGEACIRRTVSAAPPLGGN